MALNTFTFLLFRRLHLTSIHKIQQGNQMTLEPVSIITTTNEFIVQKERKIKLQKIFKLKIKF